MYIDKDGKKLGKDEGLLRLDIAKQWKEFCQELGTLSDHVHYLCTLLDNEQALPGDEYGLLFPE